MGTFPMLKTNSLKAIMARQKVQTGIINHRLQAALLRNAHTGTCTFWGDRDQKAAFRMKVKFSFVCFFIITLTLTALAKPWFLEARLIPKRHVLWGWGVCAFLFSSLHRIFLEIDTFLEVSDVSLTHFNDQLLLSWEPLLEVASILMTLKCLTHAHQAMALASKIPLALAFTSRAYNPQ